MAGVRAWVLAVTGGLMAVPLGMITLRVVLHASALTAQVAPRFTVHGTQGSLIKFGLDTQEAALKAERNYGGRLWSAPAPDSAPLAHPCAQEEVLACWTRVHGLAEPCTQRVREAGALTALLADAAGRGALPANGRPMTSSAAASRGLPIGLAVWPFCVAAMSSSLGYCPNNQ